MLGGLALGLVLLAAPAAAASSAEYSGVALPGLASPQAAHGAARDGAKVKTAQNDSQDDAAAEARKKLKKELERVRRGARGDGPEEQSKTPKQAKKDKEPASGPEASRPKQPVTAIDPAINRLAGKLIVMRFSGAQPSDGGPKAIRALLQNGLIAGAMFGAENIHTRAQTKELMKFFWQGGSEPKPIFAISEIGGAGDGLPRIKDFESWPSEQQVASKGDPEYAYSTYQSLASYLAGIGFSFNFGPALGAAAAQNPSASFGANPLQAGVFAKAFVLGHTAYKIVAVPVVDGGEASVRALKMLLLAYPDLPIAAPVAGNSRPMAAYAGLVKGARFCMVEYNQKTTPAEAADPFRRGCDSLVVDPGKESPAAIRDIVAQGIADASKQGSLTLDALEASAQRLQALKSAPPSPSTTGFATQTSQ